MPTAAPRRCSAKTPRFASLPVRRGRPDAVVQHRRERLVDPAEVGREPHHPVVGPHHTGDGHADAQAAFGAGELDQLGDRLRDRHDDRGDVMAAALVQPLAALEDDPAEPDERADDAVDVQRHRDHRHVLARHDEMRRPPRAPALGRPHLADQTQSLELRGEVADGAAVEPELGRQRGPAGRAGGMDAGQHSTQIDPAQLVLPDPRPACHGVAPFLPRTPGPTMGQARPLAAARRRLIASTLAATSRTRPVTM